MPTEKWPRCGPHVAHESRLNQTCGESVIVGGVFFGQLMGHGIQVVQGQLGSHPGPYRADDAEAMVEPLVQIVKPVDLFFIHHRDPEVRADK